MVTNISQTNNNLLDLVIDARTLGITQQATIPGWGRACFNPHSLINIISHAEITTHYQITYNSDTKTH